MRDGRRHKAYPPDAERQAHPRQLGEVAADGAVAAGVAAAAAVAWACSCAGAAGVGPVCAAGGCAGAASEWPRHCFFRGGERTSEDARAAAATVGSAPGGITGESNGEAAAGSNDRVDEGGVDPPWRETGAGASDPPVLR